MNLNEAYPSKFLKADEDVPEDGMDVTMISAELEEFGKDKKLVVKLKNMKKAFVCNKTNAKVIAKLYGDDTDDWEGERITLYATDVEFAGDMMRGIRVKTRRPTEKAKAGTKSEPEPAEAEDSIPF